VSRQAPIVLEPVTRDQAAVLNNLFELYAHDFSEYVPLDIKPSGRFDVTVGEQWWARDDHFPFFIRSGGKLCGFALVRRGSRVTGEAEVMDVAEFFVVRGARGKRVGSGAAHALFAAFPGRWEIRARQANATAIRFWARALASWLGHTVTSSHFSCAGVDWEVFAMDSPPR
jgi:predicted acetyltransferase